MKLYALCKFFSEELNLEFKGIYCKIIELAAFIGWRVKCLLVHYHVCFLQYLVVFPFFFLNNFINQLFSFLEVFGGFFGVQIVDLLDSRTLNALGMSKLLDNLIEVLVFFNFLRLSCLLVLLTEVQHGGVVLFVLPDLFV